jgi:ribonuclease HI
MEEFQVTQNIFQNTMAFTDGSMKDGAAGWGVFFKDGSKYNAYGRVSGHQTSYAGELEAIEYALNTSPITPFLIIFTDSKYAIDAIGLAKTLSPGKLSKMPEAGALRRITNTISARENKGSWLVFEHVYSHQKEKIQQDPNKWFAPIEMSNFKLSSRYPDVNYIHGNTQADRLADRGKAEPKKDFIPEGMEDFIVTELGNQIPLSIADVKKNISTVDKSKWNESANKLVHKEEDKWWSSAVSHNSLNDSGLVTWCRRARLHNRTTTALISQNLSKNESHRFRHVKEAVALQQCPFPECTEHDSQDHIFTCPYSKQALAEITTKVRHITRDYKEPIKVKRYWLSGRETLQDFQTAKPKLRVKGIHHNRKWGSLGYFPKDTLKHLVNLLGNKEGMDMAVRINQTVVESLYRIDSLRLEAIKTLIRDNKSKKDIKWAPP